MRLHPRLIFGCITLVLPLAAQPAAPEHPTAQEIVERLNAADAARRAKLGSYTAIRRYELHNHRFDKRARLVVRLTYQHPGEKSFEVISEEGPRVVRDRVLRRAIATESEASHGANRDLARIDFANYAIAFAETRVEEGRTYYLLSLTPKSKSPYLVRGHAWIDATDYALVRLEGVLAKKPSIWVGAPVVRQTYRKSGSFWLPEKNFSTTDAPVFGKTDLTIESGNYEIRQSQLTAALSIAN